MDPAPPAAKDKQSYLLRHWRGDLSLARAYWINTFAINCVLRLFGLTLSLYAEKLPVQAAPYIIVSFWVCVPTMLIWQIVGVSRSASRYARQSGVFLYPGLAWSALVVMSFTFTYSFLSSGIPQLVDAFHFSLGDPQWTDPVLTVLPTGKEIEFSGAIKANSASRLAHFLIEHPSIKLLQLDTGGGREREAVAMAAIVRQHGLNTYVGLHCESAGVVVFLAGKERILRSDARIGFHRWRAVGASETATNGHQVTILMDAGANTAFAQHVIDTPAESMWYPTPQELANQGLVTRITDGSGFSLGSRELAKYTVAGLRDELRGNPEMEALSRREPESYELAIAHAANLIAGGSDMKTSLQEIRALLASAIQNAYACASDEALDDCLDLNLEILKRNMYRSPKEAMLVLSLEAPKAILPDFPSEADSRYTIALLQSPLIPTGFSGGSHAVAEARQVLLQVSDANEAKEWSTGIPEDRLSQIAACETMNKFLTAVKALPADQRRPVIRLLFGLGLKNAKSSGTQQSPVTSPFRVLNSGLTP